MEANDHPSSIFADIVVRAADPDAGAWFENALDFAAETFNPISFLRDFSVALRRLGKTAVALNPDEIRRLKQSGALFAPEGWTAGEIGRAALMLKACRVLPSDRQVTLVFELYYKGDNFEREIVLRSLCFLPDPERFLQIAVESCRTHVQTVFESIACNNPYPARYFSDEQFNQMVLKALFTGAPLGGILGWQQRSNPELVRMAGDFASERKAAGRPVPEGIEQVLDHARCNT